MINLLLHCSNLEYNYKCVNQDNGPFNYRYDYDYGANLNLKLIFCHLLIIQHKLCSSLPPKLPPK